MQAKAVFTRITVPLHYNCYSTAANAKLKL